MAFGTLRKLLFPALAGLMLVLPQDVSGESRGQNCKRNQDCALDAFQSGEIRPLTEVLAVAREKVPGEVVKVELDREDEIWVYEIKILTPSGRRREVEINARTLAVIKVD